MSSTLGFFNNLINVLTVEDGWRVLSAAWDKLRPGVYLIIAGLTPEQLLKHKKSRHHEIDGIVEFVDRKGFYKSAISETFLTYLTQRLSNASILSQETFTFPVKGQRDRLTNVEGRRLLALKKI